MNKYLPLVLLLATACATQSPQPQIAGSASVVARAPSSIRYGAGALGKITDDDYESFPKIGNTVYLKFVAEVGSDGLVSEITFIDPRVHAFHWQFVATSDRYRDWDFKKVEAVSYRAANRQLLLGSISPQQGITEAQWDPYTIFTLTTEEVPSPALVASTQQAVNAWIAKNAGEVSTAIGDFGEQLSFQPLSAHEAGVKERIKDYTAAGITVRYMANPSGTRVYNSGMGFGKVFVAPTAKDVDEGVKAGTIGTDTVLIIGEDLRELPPVAGIVSAVPLTEASHLVLLAQMYGMPLAYQRDAINKRRADQGKWAVMQTSEEDGESFELYARLTPAETELLRKARYRPKLSVQLDPKPKDIKEVAEIGIDQVSSYGGKSTKFGLLRRTIGNFTRSKAYGIPVSYYLRFLQTAKTVDGKSLEAEVAALLKSLKPNATYAEVDAIAGRIRETMKKATPDAALVAEIRDALRTHYPGSEKIRLKIRSSSNVEDGAEFNGAGLYDSEGVCLANCDKEDFAKGLVKVWGSLYTTRGLWARRQFGVTEDQVGMGLLAHAPYKGELANGVVRFKFVLDYSGRPQAMTGVLGVRGEDESVTNPQNGGGNEQVQMRGGEVISHRPLKGEPMGRLMMAPAHYAKLENLMASLHKAWPQALGEQEIEAEWKLINENGVEKVNIKQVRAVPQPRTTNFKKGEWVFLPGHSVEYVPMSGSTVVLHPFRPDKLKFRAAITTRDQIKEGRIELKDVVLTIRGKDYPAKVGKPVVKTDEYYHDTKIDLTISGPPSFPSKYRLNWLFPVKVLTGVLPLPTVTATLAPVFPSLRDQGPRHDYFLREVGVESQEWSESKPREHRFKVQGCAVSYEGKTTVRNVMSDDEFRNFDEMAVTGILSRPIRTKGYPHALYYLKQHEVREEILVDLLSDPSLTEADKKAISKFTKGGRYLLGGNGIVFLSESLSRTKALDGCEGFGDEEGGEEG